ncbi:MAG: GGDEF domain-containing protein, partial [Verrucomicrobiota bacterium]
VCRYGGEEFLVIFPDMDLDTTLRVADKIRLSVCEDPVALPTGDAVIPITASIGATELCERNNDPGGNRMVEEADQALYQAKNSGRNRVVCFEEGM